MDTPVLLLVFNRLEPAERVLNKIKEARPEKLFISADGPRESVLGEKEKCEKLRTTLLQKVDWPCEVQTLFQDQNLGCGKGVSTGITWFFENVEKGIVLEDDCLPDASFFNYCEVLLDKYQDDKRIWSIQGVNHQDGMKRGKASYYFSFNNHVWGWASWSDRWDKYEFMIEEADESIIKKYLANPEVDRYGLHYYKSVLTSLDRIDTWDYQWLYTMWRNNGLAVIPNVNLVSNVGHSEGATHTTESDKFANKPTYNIGEIVHPEKIERDLEADAYDLKKMLNKPSLLRRAIRKIKYLLTSDR